MGEFQCVRRKGELLRVRVALHLPLLVVLTLASVLSPQKAEWADFGGFEVSL